MHQKNTALDAPLVSFTLNGRKVVAPADQTLLQAAQHHGIEVPRLCYMEGMRADGNCRTCMVEIKGERVLAPSCCRFPKDGMEVTTDSPRAVTSQKMSIELLLSDIPETSYTLDSELDFWAKKLDIGKPRFASRHQPAADLSHPAMAVHLDACIQCKRCVRACREEQVNDVIGYAFRGGHVEDRLRPRRPDGRFHLRRLRRVRPGLPHRRVDAGARRGDGGAGQDGRFGVPVLRRRLPADLQRQGQQDPVRSGPRRPRQLQPPVREGPLRLRLRAAQAPADEAAHPQAGRAEAQGLRGRSREVARGVPRSHVGRSAGPRGEGTAERSATPTASARSPASGRPSARTKRRISSRSSSAPASDRTTWTTARGCAMPRASPR